VPDDQPMTVLGHSLGAAAILRAARYEPRRFSRLILMQPVGLVGPHTVTELARRAAAKTLANLARAAGGRLEMSLCSVAAATGASAGTLARSPVVAFGEARAAARYRIDVDLAAVAGLGVPVHLITSEDDDMFDLRSLVTGVDRVRPLVASHQRLPQIYPGHDGFWLYPTITAAQVGRIVRGGRVRIISR